MEESVYGEDNFDAFGSFNCMPIEYDLIPKKYITEAVKFCQNEYRKTQAKPLRQTYEEGDTPKRDRPKEINNRWILYVPLEQMKQDEWFQSILKNVEDTLKSIHPLLRVKKFAIIKSTGGCPQQVFHYDNSTKKSKRKRYSVIFSIMDETSMVFKDAEGIHKFPWSVGLSPGSAVYFNDLTLHAGAAYKWVNYRFFFAASPKYDKEETNGNIYCVIDDKEKSWTCGNCGYKGNIGPNTLDGGKRNENRHKQICVESLIKEKNMDRKEAEDAAEAEQKRRNECSKISMRKRRKLLSVDPLTRERTGVK